MKIKVDIREKKLIPLLKALNNDYEYNIEIVSEKLDLGDIIICDDTNKELLIIERKTLTDLASSIRDGRYSEQSYRLNKETMHNHNIVYLIEGNISNYSDKYTKIKSKTLYVTMGCIQYYKGFSVIRTLDILETAEYIIRFVDKLGREKKAGYYDGGDKSNEVYSNYVTRVKKNNITPENIGEIILNQIPGISKATSAVIMNKFGSLYNLLDKLKKDVNCMKDLTLLTKTGAQRRISKTSIRNISQYLLYQKSNIIKIETK
jgi:ERCC4-type nuclease